MRRPLILLIAVIVVAGMAGCAGSGQSTQPQAEKTVRSFTGIASYYGPGFNGRRTASGERFNMHALTAAHRTLPFGTRVRVTNLSNNLSVIVRINDRGPHKKSRVIDVSLAAAKKIGMVRTGTAKVRVDVLK